MSKKRGLFLLGTIFFILGGVFITLYFTQRPQDTRGSAQSCASVPSVMGVTVEYPGCTGNSCDFTKASCSWTALAQASSYRVTVSVVETGAVILNNASYPASTTQILFPVGQTNTYKCSVVAVNSCGNQSTPSSDQLLCVTDGLLSPTNTPTITPTRTPTPTGILIQTPTPTKTFPTATPRPTNFVAPTVASGSAIATATPYISQPGGMSQTIAIAGVVLLLILGGVLLIAL